MCGIAGIYNYDKNDNILNDTLEIMKKLQHRGKDSYGLSFYNNKINIIKKKRTDKQFSNRCIRKYSIMYWTFKIQNIKYG